MEDHDLDPVETLNKFLTNKGISFTIPNISDIDFNIKNAVLAVDRATFGLRWGLILKDKQNRTNNDINADQKINNVPFPYRNPTLPFKS